jgi:hypothetical protein
MELTGDGLHLNLALAISEKEQLVPVWNVKIGPDFCGPKVAILGAPMVLRHVQVPLFALQPGGSADRLRMHARARGLSQANSGHFTHIGNDRIIHIDIHRSVFFVVIHLFCFARGIYFALVTLVGAGGDLTYLSGAFILMSRHRSRDDARRLREGQTTAT